MLGKPRVNTLDGGGWDKAEKDFAVQRQKLVRGRKGAIGVSPAVDNRDSQRISVKKRSPSFQGLGFEMWSSRSFWALLPGLISASFCDQS